MKMNIVSHVDEVKSALESQVAKALSTVGFAAESNAKALAPVDTGRLRGSLTHLVDDRSVTIGTNVEYAKYQEFGTSKMKAQPFLEPAITNHMEQYKEIIRNELKG